MKVVGGSVGAIVKDIADGKAPNQSDMANVTQDEREYLSQLIRTCDVAIPNGIPTTKKTTTQKKTNDFEILKGQVLAGNDNPELLKKFKALLIKMVQNNQLNEHEVKAIIDEMP